MLSSKFKFFKKFLRSLTGILGASLLLSSIPVYATDKEAVLANNQAMPVESNQWADWPAGPVVSAESAILMDAETGVILYSKNIHTKQYPASTTKILTTLIAIENSDLNEMVEFSYKATHDIDPGSNHIGLDAGEQLSMEDCLKAILVRSANEVSFGVAEHIAGDTWETFGPIMNQRAKELGCLNSNFINPNGLPNKEHVTTAYDLAMIGRAFFDNEILCQMTQLKQIHFYPTDTQPDEIWENNQMALIPGKEYAYDALVGCKTGYTNDARSCLVSCAEKNGMKLICVVLKDESPYQYEDTIALFEYGFHNFEKKNVSQNETKYNIDANSMFYSGNDLFGNSQPLLSLNEQDCIILPKNVPFSKLSSTITYDTENEKQAATITYKLNDIFVGNATVEFTLEHTKDYEFNGSLEEESVSSQEIITPTAEPVVEEKEPAFVFINWKKILLFLAIILGLLGILALVLLFLKNYQINTPDRVRNARTRRSHRRRRTTRQLSFDLKQKRRQQIADARRRQRRTRRH